MEMVFWGLNTLYLLFLLAILDTSSGKILVPQVYILLAFCVFCSVQFSSWSVRPYFSKHEKNMFISRLLCVVSYMQGCNHGSRYHIVYPSKQYLVPLFTNAFHVFFAHYINCELIGFNANNFQSFFNGDKQAIITQFNLGQIAIQPAYVTTKFTSFSIHLFCKIRKKKLTPLIPSMVGLL